MAHIERRRPRSEQVSTAPSSPKRRALHPRGAATAMLLLGLVASLALAAGCGSASAPAPPAAAPPTSAAPAPAPRTSATEPPPTGRASPGAGTTIPLDTPTSPATDRARAGASGEVTATTITIEDPKVGPLRFDALVAGDPDAAADGRLVLLLHGFPETDESYRDLLAPLATDGYFAVAFNQRGYSSGARPAAVEAYNILELVSDVMLVADHFGASTFHVVGHDWGGAVAWATAAQHREAVRTLTALSTPHPDALSAAMADEADPQHRASAYMQTFRAPGSEDRLLANGRASFVGIFGPGAGGLPQEKVDAYADVLATPPALGAALNWYRASPLPSPVRLGAVAVPTVYVFGAADGAFAASTARATASYVTGPYRYVELPGQGHWLPENAAPAVLDALRAHLAGTDPAR